MRTAGSLLALVALAAAFSPPIAAAPPDRAPAVGVSMNYDVVEEVSALFAAHFDTDFAALADAKDVLKLDRIRVLKRIPVQVAVGAEEPAPTLSLYSPSTLTNARNQARRDSRVTLLAELFIRGPNAEHVRAQADIGLEAILLTIDRIAADAGEGVYGAGEEEFGVRCTLDGTADVTGGQEQYEETARVEFVVWDRDELS